MFYCCPPISAPTHASKVLHHVSVPVNPYTMLSHWQPISILILCSLPFLTLVLYLLLLILPCTSCICNTQNPFCYTTVPIY